MCYNKSVVIGMGEIHKNLLIENDDFSIYGNNDLHPIVVDLLFYLTSKKKEFLSFFQLEEVSKIKIVLFENREEYNDYVHHFFTPSDYSKAGILKDAIHCCYSRIPRRNLLSFFKLTLSHELVHILYSYLYENFARPVWLDEGLSQILSLEMEKLAHNDFAFRTFYFDRIVRRDKEIPPIHYLKKHGNGSGLFLDSKTNKYDGYALSYIMVRYLMETQKDFHSILVSEEKIKEVEKTILEDTIRYFNEKYPVKSHFYDIKTDGELMDYMNKNIVYGWLDSNKNEHIDTLKDFRSLYRTSSIEEILDSKIATCIGQAKLIQYWFSLQGIENKLFCLRNSLEVEQDEIEMHCFVLYHYQNFWYHFEHSAFRKRGIYKFATLEEAIEKTCAKFLEGYALKELVEIPTIPDGLTFQAFNEYVSQFETNEIEKEKLR